jgi:hypothetical protein
MVRSVAITAAVVAALIGEPARGDDRDGEAERALQRADQRAVARDPAAIDAYEALGAAQPVTRWSDDAWVRAAGLAERAGDFARARRDLERAIAITGAMTGAGPGAKIDRRLVEQARADLARLTALTDGGRWDRVAAEHDRLAGQLAATTGDPVPALTALEALVVASPGYPRAASAVLTVAQGWERDGDADHAIAWLAARRGEQAAGDGALELASTRLSIALIRLCLRHGELEPARRELGRYEALPRADRKVVAELQAGLVKASHRQWLRIALWAVVAILAGLAGLAVVRDPRGWRAALRGLVRPPIEVVFLLPIGVVLAGVAATGNPMVARAVRQIVVAGLAIAWLSGGRLEARRQAQRAIGARHVVGHVALVMTAVAALSYLALDHDHMLDVVAETWRAGPSLR